MSPPDLICFYEINNIFFIFNNFDDICFGKHCVGVSFFPFQDVKRTSQNAYERFYFGFFVFCVFGV